MNQWLFVQFAVNSWLTEKFVHVSRIMPSQYHREASHRECLTREHHSRAHLTRQHTEHHSRRHRRVRLIWEALLRKLLTILRILLRNLSPAAEEYYENGTIPSSAVLIGILTIAYVFATVLNLISKIFYALSSFKKQAKGLYRLLGMSYGEYLDSIGYTRWDILNDYSINVGTIFQSIFFPIIYIVLMGATVFGLFYLIDAVVLKKKTDVNKIASLCGAVSVPLIGAIAVKILYNFIRVGALRGFFFPIFIVFMSVLTAIQGFTILSKEIKDRKQLVISLAILVVGLVTVEYLIGLFLYKSATFFTLPGVPFI